MRKRESDEQKKRKIIAGVRNLVDMFSLLNDKNIELYRFPCWDTISGIIINSLEYSDHFSEIVYQGNGQLPIQRHFLDMWHIKNLPTFVNGLRSFTECYHFIPEKVDQWRIDIQSLCDELAQWLIK